ncbi:LPXTG cell wall anchor domain-containing protein [Arthrobacter sp. D2-10]
MRNRLWAAAVISAGLVGVGAMPAVAADPLLFSLDGEEWATELTDPIFDETPVLVPGDEASGSFWVRNASADPADLKVALVTDWPTDGAEPQGLWVSAVMDDAPAVSGGGTDRVLLVLDSMDALDSRKVTVTVGLHAAAGNSSQNVSRPMAFDVRLTQSIPDTAPGIDDPVSPAPDDGSDVVASVPDRSVNKPEARTGEPFGTLADTGFTALWVAVAGAALAAGGLLAVAWGRKKKSTSEEGSHGAA